MKKCGCCTFTKEASCFRMMKEKRTKVQSEYLCSICKECERKRALERWHQNKEICSDQNKKYKSENKEKINKTRREYMANKMKIPSERLKRNMKSLISAKLSKTRHTCEYLGAPITLIVKWMEFNMDENMSWENYGKYWQIDHTIPINLFDLSDEDEALLCFSWMNLMPLETIKNAQKSDTLNVYRIFHQERQVVQFGQQNSIVLKQDIQLFLGKYTKKLGSLLHMQHA